MSLSKATSVLDLIGNTPLVKVTKIDTGYCDLYLKLENLNPGGSIKDRIARSMINEAEDSQKIKPGDTIIEATAGNTGLGLALIAAQKKYRLLITIPDKMSPEKIALLKAMGAEVIVTRSDVFKGDPEYYQEVAENLAREMKNAYYINQFNNPANVEAHFSGTGPEIWHQMDYRVDAIVLGVGTGGTLTGIGRFIKSVSPDTQMILADPCGSILAHKVNTGLTQPPGRWLVEGIGEDFIPSICDLSLVDEAMTVSDQETIWSVRELLKQEGIMGGFSSGTLFCAALRYCRAQKTKKRVVTLVPDTGNRYLSKCFNDTWVKDHGLSVNNEI